MHTTIKQATEFTLQWLGARLVVPTGARAGEGKDEVGLAPIDVGSRGQSNLWHSILIFMKTLDRHYNIRTLDRHYNMRTLDRHYNIPNFDPPVAQLWHWQRHLAGLRWGWLGYEPGTAWSPRSPAPPWSIGRYEEAREINGWRDWAASAFLTNGILTHPS